MWNVKKMKKKRSNSETGNRQVGEEVNGESLVLESTNSVIRYIRSEDLMYCVVSAGSHTTVLHTCGQE